MAAVPMTAWAATLRRLARRMTMRTPFALVLILALISVPSLAGAQRQSTLEVGDRVRLTLAAARRSPIVGTISALSDSQLALSRSGAGRPEESFAWATGARPSDETFAWAQMARAERRTGTGSLALLGALVGIIAGIAVDASTTPPNRTIFDVGEDLEKAALLVGGGLLVGVAVGSSIRYEKWRRVSLDSRLGFRSEPEQILLSAGIATKF